MSELDKLEKYLLEHRITYERYEVHEEWDSPADLTFIMDRHQICVPEEGEACRWDAICFKVWVSCWQRNIFRKHFQFLSIVRGENERR